tara:strand:+ start:274 stop:471 length:198 start_codon:yes stop_codon:yes gene_type:complete
MAKKQTFGDKTKKAGDKAKSFFKVVRTKKNKDTEGIRFNEEMLGIPPEENADNFIKKYLDDNNVK